MVVELLLLKVFLISSHNHHYHCDHHHHGYMAIYMPLPVILLLILYCDNSPSFLLAHHWLDDQVKKRRREKKEQFMLILYSLQHIAWNCSLLNHSEYTYLLIYMHNSLESISILGLCFVAGIVITSVLIANGIHIHSILVFFFSSFQSSHHISSTQPFLSFHKSNLTCLNIK